MTIAVENFQQIRDEIEQRFACAHPRAKLRVKVASNGARHYRVQCMRCGEGRQATREERARFPDPEPFDEELREAWWTAKSKAMRDAYQRERRAKTQAWFDQYSEYLMSAAWRWKRTLVLERDEYRCLAQLPDCTGQAEQVHHITYAHWWEAPLFELVSVCGSCHTQITEMDRTAKE